MISVILSWIYIAFICCAAGMGTFRLFGKIIGPTGRSGALRSIIAGIVTLTVYGEYFSLIYRVSMLCHIIMLAAAVSCAYICREDMRAAAIKAWHILCSWEGVFYISVMLVTAFCTSRGVFRTDTGIYHAQAIRLYEEYGYIKGVANLQLHFGYNSSYFAFCALFTMSWLLPQAMHTTTGFIELLCVIYALRSIKNYGVVTEGRKRSWTVVAASAAILVYTVINITGSMSPATDYTTIFMSLFMITEWLINHTGSCNSVSDRINGDMDCADETVNRYIALSVLAVFITGMKLSSGCLVIAAAAPLVIMLRRRQYRKTLLSLLAGIMVILPFLIRNVLISGWLIYPFEGIDIFNVAWKVPVRYLRVDAAQIQVWGKALFDVDKQGMPIREWLPIWWQHQEHYDQMMIYADIISAVLMLVNLCRHIKSKQVSLSLVMLYVSLAASYAMWFLEAPFIRYGLTAILMLPFITAGIFADDRHGGFGRWFGSAAAVLMMLAFCSLTDNYMTGDIVFVKHNISSAYYIWQQPFDDNKMGYEELDGNKIYYPVKGEVNSYYYCPSTCYKMMLDRSELIGNTIKSGFRAKKQ